MKKANKFEMFHVRVRLLVDFFGNHKIVYLTTFAFGLALVCYPYYPLCG